MPFIRIKKMSEIDSLAASNCYVSADGILFNKERTVLTGFPLAREGACLIPGTVAEIGEGAFEGCVKLTEVVFPNSVERISNWAFAQCSGLTEVVLPESVTEVGEWAFSSCSKVAKVVIPASVRKVGKRAFYGCESMDAVYVNNPDPGTIALGRWAFCYRPSSLENTTLYVPKGSEAQYAVAPQWRDFGKIQGISFAAENIVLREDEEHVQVGDTLSFSLFVQPDYATGDVEWVSDNTSVVKVDSNGSVKAVGVGHAKITAVCAGVEASCLVIVSPKKVQAVTLSRQMLELFVGDTHNLTAVVTPADATRKQVNWTSADPSIVEIDYFGRLKAVSPGKTSVMAGTADGKYCTCIVVVKPQPEEVEGVTLDNQQLTLHVGESFLLRADIHPKRKNPKSTTWTSSDTGIITVDNGMAVGVAPGYATIVAECGGKYAMCTVTVEE